MYQRKGCGGKRNDFIRSSQKKAINEETSEAQFPSVVSSKFKSTDLSFQKSHPFD